MIISEFLPDSVLLHSSLTDLIQWFLTHNGTNGRPLELEMVSSGFVFISILVLYQCFIPQEVKSIYACTFFSGEVNH